MTKPISPLLALSPLDGRYASQTQELSLYFSEFALIKYRCLIEIEWLLHLSSLNEFSLSLPLTDGEKQELRTVVENFTLADGEKIKALEKNTNHDVKAVEYFIKETLNKVSPKSCVEMTHFACTSEDINNLSYALMLKNALERVIFPLAEELLENIHQNSEKYRHAAMVSRTHGQTASPTTMGREIYIFAVRLERALTEWKNLPILGKINGATGNFNAHYCAFPDINWPAFSKNFVEKRLGLIYNPYTTQIEPHDFIAAICHAGIRFNSILLDFSRDMWSYISINAFQQIPVAGHIGSSTMPHKVNPIDFENAEGNLGLANALFEHLATKLPISRWQRDLSDSTVMRNLGSGFGHALIALQSLKKGLNKVSLNGEFLRNELANSWELLAEGIQTVMRKHGVLNSYEILKEHTQGKSVNREVLWELIQSIDLPEEARESLRQLTPENYLGRAANFGRDEFS